MINSIHIYPEKLSNFFNEGLINGKFLNATTILKKEKIMKTKITALWLCSRLFQKYLKNYYLNKLTYIDHIQFKKHQFSKHLKDFCKIHSTQNALLLMTEKWKGFLWILFLFLFMDFSNCLMPRSLSIVSKINCVRFW